jgi:hypothetical protein
MGISSLYQLGSRQLVLLVVKVRRSTALSADIQTLSANIQKA